MSDTTPQSAQERYTQALAALKGQQRRFVAEYLVDLRQRDAAIRAGYSAKSADSQASQLLKNPKVAAAVAAGLEAQAMPAAEVLARLSAQARGSMADFVRVDEEEVQVTWSILDLPVDREGNPDLPGAVYDLARQKIVKPTQRVLHTATVKRAVARLDLLAAGQAGKLGLVKKYAIDGEKVSIELYDAKAALDSLAKARGLFVERTQQEPTPDIDWDRVPDDIQIAFLERRMALAQVVAHLAQHKEP